MRCTGLNRSDVAPAECGDEFRSEGGSFGGPIRRRSRTLRLFCVHSASRSSGSFRTPSRIFRALIELCHSLFEITRFRRGKARTLLFGSLPRRVGQRLENRRQRRGAGRITPITKNLQENPDILSLMWISGKQAVAAGARASRRTRAGRRRMRDPGRKRLRDRFFIGKAALRPFALELPVQVGRQANGGFNCISGTHKVRLPKLRIFLRHLRAGARATGGRLQAQRKSSCRLLRSSIRTEAFLIYLLFIRERHRMQEFCSEFRTEAPGTARRRGASDCFDPTVGPSERAPNAVTVTRTKAVEPLISVSVPQMGMKYGPYLHVFKYAVLPFCRKVACKYPEFTVQG
jgi:hypothetical protein